MSLPVNQSEIARHGLEEFVRLSEEPGGVCIRAARRGAGAFLQVTVSLRDGAFQAEAQGLKVTSVADRGTFLIGITVPPGETATIPFEFSFSVLRKEGRLTVDKVELVEREA